MKFFLCALGFGLCACGGAVDTSLLDGGDGGGGSDGGTQQDGHPGTDGGQITCDALAQQIQAAEAAATECCPTCNVVQCTQQVDGLCCPLTVNNKDSTAVKAYESALQAFNDAKCVANCPAIACSTQPTNKCMQSGNNGTCAQF